MYKCCLCSTNFKTWSIHKASCIGISKFLKESKSFVFFQEEVRCKNCWKQIQQSEISNHRKNCLRQIRKANKKLKSTKSMPQLNQSSLIISSLPIQSADQSTFLQESLYRVGSQILRVLVPAFVEKTTHLSSTVASSIFSGKIHEPFLHLDWIPKISIETLKNKYGYEVFDIIKEPQDIFNVQRVSSLLSLSRMGIKKKNELIKQCNEFLKICRVQKLYKPIAISKETKKQKIILLYRELIQFVLQLFQSKRKKKIHLGLDLLIIFQSAQRFPSSKTIILEKIKQILKGKERFALIGKTTKTYTRGHFIVSSDLKKALLKFKWQGFLLSSDKMSRLSKIVGASLIAFRRGFFIQMINGMEKQVDFSKYTMHTTNQVASIYLQSLILSQKKQFHQKLTIPKNAQQLSKISRLDMINKLELKILDETIFKDDEDFDFYDINFTISEKTQTIKPKYTLSFDEQQSENEQQRPRVEKQEYKINELQQRSTSEFSQIEQIRINKSEFTLINGNFNLSQVYILAKGKTCYKCNEQNSTHLCRFCSKNFHQNCLELFCICMKFNQISQGFLCQNSSGHSRLQIIMPQKYLKNNTNLLNNFRFLIHMRGFYYTNVSRFRTTAFGTCQDDLGEIKLPYYLEYAKGQYFPPLRLGISGDDNLYGTGVGVFALQKIEKNVFIGQYGGDIINENELIVTKRQDMNMQLHQSAKETYFVGSIQHSSYVQLINSSVKGINCKTVRCNVNNMEKLLLYSCQLIQAGEELLYDYQGDFDNKFLKGLKRQILYQPTSSDLNDQAHIQPQKQNQIIQSLPLQVQEINGEYKNKRIIQLDFKDKRKIITQKKNSKILKKLKKIIKTIKAYPNSCYATAILTIFFYIRSSFTDFQSSFPLIKDIYDPLPLISQFTKTAAQEDATEFFIFIQNFLGEISPFKKLKLKSTLKCTSCHHSNYKIVEDDCFYITQKMMIKEMKQINMVEKICDSCQEIKLFQEKKQLINRPKYVLFFIKRYTNNLQKLNIQVNYSSKIAQQNCQYEPTFILLHNGNLNEGHYKVYLEKQNLIVNGAQVSQINEDDNISNQIYLIGYTQSKCSIQEAILSQKDGLIILNQNSDSFYKIASIVKIFVVLVAQDLQAKLQWQDKRKLKVPKINFYGSSSKLREGDLVQLRDLYHLALIPSCCVAAQTLSYGFEINKQQFLYKISEKLIQLQLFDTCVDDVNGLGQSISTTKDLLKLIKTVKQNQKITNIMKNGFWNYKGTIFPQTNLTRFVGKTGTTPEGYHTFIGFRNQTMVAALGWKSTRDLEMKLNSLLNS